MSVELHPATQAMADALFQPGFFDVDPRRLVKSEGDEKRNSVAKPAGVTRSGQKSLLSAKDFVLPELVKKDDNGDLSVSVGSSSDSAQLEQIFRLAECGEEPPPSFADLSHAEQQLEKRRAGYPLHSPRPYRLWFAFGLR